MATDQSLATLLRALQVASNDQDISRRLLGSAATLLTLLHNPLNITLLSAQLLSAPAIWDRPDEQRTALRVLGIFNSATASILQHEKTTREPNNFVLRSGLAQEDWIRAVIKGADERSPRWRHLLLLGGVLLGSERQDPQAITVTLRRKLESAMTSALNLVLQEVREGSDLAINTLVLTTNYVFGLLSDTEKARINYDRLLPLVCWALFFSVDGLHFGYFLSTIDADIVEGSDQKFNWSSKSPSFDQIRRMAKSPLVSSLGSLSRLLAHCMEHVQDVGLLRALIGDVSAFSRSIGIQWRQNKLSEIDAHEEAVFLIDESLQNSLPVLWQTLKSCMFCIVIILRPLLGRVLQDGSISMNDAPILASQTLQVLRDLSFISNRFGANTFSQYIFIYFAAIDILSQYPAQAESFLEAIKPTEIGSIPPHPLDRCHDLYFLDIAEHFPLVLSPEVSEQLLLRASMPYLGVGGDQRLLEAFEAAHSVILAIFLAPQNFNLVISHIHPYIDALFQVFPQNLSSRQFRMAIKTLVRVTSAPSVLSEQDPLLSSTILQLVLQRLETATSNPLQSPWPLPLLSEAKTAQQSAPTISSSSPPSSSPEVPFTEQAALILTLIDSLPFINLPFLEEWLNITASSINNYITDTITATKLPTVTDTNTGIFAGNGNGNSIGDNTNTNTAETMKQICRDRFWEIITNGEMDMAGVERAEICVGWWTTRGGREAVLGLEGGRGNGGVKRGDEVDGMSGGGAVMSGALLHEQSKL